MRRRAFLALLGSSTLLLAGCQRRNLGSTDTRVKDQPPGSPPLDPMGQWPSFRFDSGNTGHNPSARGLREAEQYWRLDAGSVASVADGTLYNIYGSWDYPNHSVNPDPRAEEYDSTDLVRRDPTTAAVRSRTTLHSLYTEVNCPPTVADGRVYVSSYLYTFCLDPDQDEILWRTPQLEGIRGSPVVRNGSVYIAALRGPNGNNRSESSQRQPVVLSLSATTGEIQWRYDIGTSVRSPPAVTNGTVFVNAENALHAIDSATGEPRYTIEHPVETIQYGIPVATSDTVYLIIREEERAQLVSVGADSGEVRWKTPVPGFGQQIPVVTDNAVYVGTDTEVSVLDPSDGTESATYDSLNAPLARVGSVLYGTAGNAVIALDALSGDLLWSHQTEQVRVEDVSYSGVVGITPVSNAVYVRAADALYAFGSS